MQERARRRVAEAAKADRDRQEGYLAHSLEAHDTETLGIDLHHLLKRYPNVRERWLQGEPLDSLLDETHLAAGATKNSCNIREHAMVDESARSTTAIICTNVWVCHCNVPSLSISSDLRTRSECWFEMHVPFVQVRS